jgi:eukaryotic-like serine/threonine-protein kinase
VLATAIDILDAAPTWSCPTGTALVAGHLAVRRLGVGHRCETWLTWSTARWCPIVVKLARPHQVGEPRLRAALTREARHLRELPHPGLPALLDDRHDDARPHLLLTHLDGPALDELVADARPLTAVEAATLGLQLGSVLRWLHGHGLAHLDLTPANVVLRERRPHLVDLGSCRPVGDTDIAPATVGTPGYTAPELEAGAPITTAMDLYGLGATLVHALTGAAPSAERPLPADVPARLRTTLAALLHPDPGARPGPDEILGRLRAITGARTAGWPRAAAAHLRRRR